MLHARTWAPRLVREAGSRPESLLRHLLIDAELPNPDVQVPVCDRWGNEVAHADLGYRRWKVAMEYEGRQHAERGRFGRDIDRYSLMAAGGWLVLRFTTSSIARPALVVDRVGRALNSRGGTW